MKLEDLKSYENLETLCMENEYGHILRGIAELYVPFYINVFKTDQTTHNNEADDMYLEKEAKKRLFELFNRVPKNQLTLVTHKPTYYLMQQLRNILQAKAMETVI